MKLEKLLILLLALVLCVGLVTGCTSNPDSDEGATASEDTTGTGTTDAAESSETPEQYTNMVVEVTGITDNTINYAVCTTLEDGEVEEYATFDASPFDATDETGSITLDDDMQTMIYRYDEENWVFAELTELAVGDKLIIVYDSSDEFAGLIICA